MAPYEADRHKKEREALNLIISMKKQKSPASSGVQIFFFVVMPVLCALFVMRFREIQVFAQQNKQVSAVIKMFYPAWKSVDDFPQPVLPPVVSAKDATEKAVESTAETSVKSGGSKGSAGHHRSHTAQPQ